MGYANVSGAVSFRLSERGPWGFTDDEYEASLLLGVPFEVGPVEHRAGPPLGTPGAAPDVLSEGPAESGIEIASGEDVLALGEAIARILALS
jgi:hypothetical protein